MIKPHVTYTLVCNWCGVSTGQIYMSERLAQADCDYAPTGSDPTARRSLGWLTLKHMGRAGEIIEHLCPICKRKHERQQANAAASYICQCALSNRCPVHPNGPGTTPVPPPATIAS